MSTDELGRRIAAARKKADKKQDTLALEVGISRQYLSLIERGRKSPRAVLVARIAKACGISPLQLHGGRLPAHFATHQDSAIHEKLQAVLDSDGVASAALNTIISICYSQLRRTQVATAGQ